MITPAEINLKYHVLGPYLPRLQKYVQETLSVHCAQNAFALVSRVKTLESLCEKIESGRYANWSQIDDLVAFAIVIPTLMDEERTIEFLDKQFRCIEVKRRGTTRKAPDVFRFDSTRFVGRLRTPPDAAPDRPIDQISFEVQVRSAFDHAWIVTTHALAYKTPVIDWKQQRLAAELKATTEKMDLLVLAFQQASQLISESPWPKIEAKRQIHTFFLSLSQDHQIPTELLPKDWSRFVDNVYELGRRCAPEGAPETVANTVIESMRRELSELGLEKIPLSLSLWQMTLASLAKNGVLRAPLRDFWPLITPQMEALYPSVKNINPRFDLA